MSQSIQHPAMSDKANNFIAVAAIILVLLWSVVAMSPPPQSSKSDFEKSQLSELLASLGYDGKPRITGTPAAENFRNTLKQQLTKQGYIVEQQRGHECGNFSSHCGEVVNLLIRHSSQTSQAKPVVLASHYDSVGAGAGVGDALINLAVMLQIEKRVRASGEAKRPISILLTDGEEYGLIGAKVFVRDQAAANNVFALINLEARGTSGRSHMFETSQGNSQLMSYYADAVDSPSTSSLFLEIYRNMNNATDFTVFKRHGIQGYNFAFIGNSGFYHTERDDLNELNYDSVAHQGESAAALASKLVTLDQLPPASSNQAFLTFAGSIVGFDISLVLPLAIFSLLLLIATLIRLNKQHQATIKPFFKALGRQILTLVLVPVAVYIVIFVVQNYLSGWVAEPLPAQIAVLSAIIMVGLVMAKTDSNDTQAQLLLLAGWIIIAIFSLILAVLSAGAAIILVIPTLLAAIVLLLTVSWQQQTIPVVILKALLILVVGHILLFASLQMLEAVSLGSAHLISLLIALVLIVTVPVLKFTSETLKRSRIVFSTVLVMSLLWASFVPRYTNQMPQWKNLYYSYNADQQASQWVMEDGAASDAIKAVVPFETTENPLPWLLWGDEAQTYNAIAPTQDYTPTLEVIERKKQSEATQITVRINTPLTQAYLYIPADSGFIAANYHSSELEFRPRSQRRGFQRLGLLAIPDSGSEVTLTFSSKATDKVLLTLVAIDKDLPGKGKQLQTARNQLGVAHAQGDQALYWRQIPLALTAQ